MEKDRRTRETEKVRERDKETYRETEIERVSETARKELFHNLFNII
jgi:hypothetical protein